MENQSIKNLKSYIGQLRSLERRLNMYADPKKFINDMQKEIRSFNGNYVTEDQIWDMFNLLEKRIKKIKENL